VQSILKDVQGIRFVYFDDQDVVRHHLVSAIVRAYDAHSIRSRNDGAGSSQP
jgi:phosphate starvation-inducible PhoH-like protein